VVQWSLILGRNELAVLHQRLALFLEENFRLTALTLGQGRALGKLGTDPVGDLLSGHGMEIV